MTPEQRYWYLEGWRAGVLEIKGLRPPDETEPCIEVLPKPEPTPTETPKPEPPTVDGEVPW